MITGFFFEPVSGLASDTQSCSVGNTVVADDKTDSLIKSRLDGIGLASNHVFFDYAHGFPLTLLNEFSGFRHVHFRSFWVFRHR